MQVIGKIHVQAIRAFSDGTPKSQVDALIVNDNHVVVGTLTLDVSSDDATALTAGAEVQIGGTVTPTGVFAPKEEAETTATT